MSDDDITQQLAEWKQKYYQSITDLEQQENYKELLQKSLARLALAAQGLDPALDLQLKSLRNILRGNHDKSAIERILASMETAIATMENAKATDDSSSSGKILASLLSSLKLPKQVKADAKSLSLQLTSAANSDIMTLSNDVLALLDKSLSLARNNKSNSLFGFLGLGASTTQDDNEAHDPVDFIDLNESIEGEMPANLVLMKLLEHISLPNDLSKKATIIRHQIESGLDNKQLPIVINDIADIVSSLGNQALTEKHEYEQFLQTLTSRLTKLNQHISQTADQDSEAFQQRNIISEAVKDEVVGLRSHVKEANNLDQLKSSVSERLDTINDHFEDYRQADHQRFEQSQVQIKALNKRLEAMEEEGNSLRKLAEESRKSALKDALTEIWNRQALNDNLEKEFSRWQRYQKPLSIVIWDIDFFKRVNDEYGHAAGDKVLKTIARIFTKATRDADFIARFGGEEFVGIFPETRLEDALKLANKIREKVANSKFHYENRPVAITASAGLATFLPNDTIEAVFKRADAALYRAKESGRNKCIIDS